MSLLTRHANVCSSCMAGRNYEWFSREAHFEIAISFYHAYMRFVFLSAVSPAIYTRHECFNITDDAVEY